VMMASAKMKDGSPSAATAGKTISKEASPDSKCPICLDGFRNISYVDKCLHRFCFRCIQEWAKNKAECPLCKQPFTSIYHSIQSEHDFQQYRLRPTETGSFGSLAGHRFRYRTTLTGDRRPERRTSPPPDHGVMFEGLSGKSPVSQGNDRGFRRMVARLAARQRAQGEGRTLRTLQEQELIQFRRMLYRRGLRVRDVRDGGRSRDTSAEFFRGNPACLHRLVPWLKRELTVLYGTHGSLVNIVQHIVMSQITRYDMLDPAVLQELRPFLLSRTEHFLHEFQSFARSPFNMEAYDQNAVYDCPAPSADDSGSDSSVITVSEDEAGLTGARVPVTLSQTPWDDETPGLSYSTEPPPVFTVSVASSNSDSEEEPGPVVAGVDDHSGSEDDCMIVGFVKPTSERTPELVQLSSDTEEEEEEEVKEKETKRIPLVIRTQPQHIRFTSPPDSPSSHQSASPHRPTATGRDRPSLDRRPASPRCSSTNRRHENSRDEERRRSESKRRDVSGYRDSSSRGHKRRSRSKDRRQSKETSSFYRHQTHLSHTHLSYKHHSYESSRTHTRTHYSYIRRSPETRDHSRAQSQGRSYAQDRSRSRERNGARPQDRARPQERSISQKHYRAGSRERSRARSRDHSRGLSQERSISRECARSRDRSRARSQERSIIRERARSREHYRSRSHERSHARSCERSRARSTSRSRSRKSRSRERRQTGPPSPSSTHRKSRHVKPGGKRKYKSLHLEPSGTEETEDPAEDRKQRSRGKRERKRERKHRSSRSPSVEIVYEGDSGEALLKKRQHKKKKHKKKSRRKRSRERRERKSLTVITINSESESDADETTAKRHGADDTNVTLNITDLRDNKTAPSLTFNSNAKTAANSAEDAKEANDANASSTSTDIPAHSESQSDQNMTAFSLNMNHSSTGANDSVDANDANSISIPSTCAAESPQTSRTVPDSAEPEPEPLPSHAQNSGTRHEY
uniref:E3 ubiquitin-protein ligase Topors n=1 Tax=Astyanax mexicanus TaxID=7994 RepID=A0A8B9H014_ASTMX